MKGFYFTTSTAGSGYTPIVGQTAEYNVIDESAYALSDEDRKRLQASLPCLSGKRHKTGDKPAYTKGVREAPGKSAMNTKEAFHLPILRCTCERAILLPRELDDFGAALYQCDQCGTKLRLEPEETVTVQVAREGEQKVTGLADDQ